MINSVSTPQPTGRIAELIRIGEAGVQHAIEESRRLGVPNVYSLDGVLHWELPSGELVTYDPWEEMQAARRQHESGENQPSTGK